MADAGSDPHRASGLVTRLCSCYPAGLGSARFFGTPRSSRPAPRRPSREAAASDRAPFCQDCREKSTLTNPPKTALRNRLHTADGRALLQPQGGKRLQLPRIIPDNSRARLSAKRPINWGSRDIVDGSHMNNGTRPPYLRMEVASPLEAFLVRREC